MFHSATPWTAAARLPYPSLSPGVCPNSCALSRWCYLISHPLPPYSPFAFSLSQHQGLLVESFSEIPQHLRCYLCPKAYYGFFCSQPGSALETELYLVHPENELHLFCCLNGYPLNLLPKAFSSPFSPARPEWPTSFFSTAYIQEAGILSVRCLLLYTTYNLTFSIST